MIQGPMDSLERAERVEMHVPIRVRALDAGLAPRLFAEAVNVSATGLLFATSARFESGTPVEVLFRMPEEIVGHPSNDWRCKGEVVRVEEHQTPTTRYDVGVRFVCYEVLGRQLP